jgi:hypothetical protein
MSWQFLIQCRRQPNFLASCPAEDQILATPRRHAMIAGLRDCSGRTGFDTGRTKDAPAQIEGDALARRLCDRLGWTHRRAFLATPEALALIHSQCAAMPIRQRRRRPLRIGHRLATAFQSMSEGVEDEHKKIRVTDRSPHTTG